MARGEYNIMNKHIKDKQIEHIKSKFKINPDDLKIEPFRSSGKGGQHRNKTETAIRVTHIPTNTVVVCANERSQHQNKELALKAIQIRLLSEEIRKENERVCDIRRDQVGSAERNKKIRTYDFKKKVVYDSRLPGKSFRLKEILDGELDDLLHGLLMLNNQKKGIIL